MSTMVKYYYIQYKVLQGIEVENRYNILCFPNKTNELETLYFLLEILNLQ